MKKQVKKIYAILIVMVMALSLSLTAFAAETGSTPVTLTEATNGTVTFQGAGDTDEFKLYQVMKVEYNTDTNELKYVPSADFVAFLADTTYNTSGVSSFTDYQALADESDNLKLVLGQFTKYCVQKSVTASYTATGNATINPLDIGQYVVYGTSTTSKNVFSSMTASFPVEVEDNQYKVNRNVTIDVKKTTPTIKKEIAETDDKQVAIGDYIGYEIVTSVPQYPADAVNTTYKVGDKLGTGLEFPTGYTIKVEATAAAGNWSGAAELTSPEAYTEETKTNTEFGLSFIYDTIKGYKEIKVTYEAVVTSAAVVTTGMANNATVEFSTNPYDTGDHTEEKEDTKTVYTYEIDVIKVDSTDASKTLSGVEFTVNKQGEVANLTFSGTTGNYKYDPAGSVTTLVTGADGKLIVAGLDVGTYEFKETKAATGYALPTTPFTVTITDADIDGMVDDTENNNGIVETKFTNVKNDGTLPQTGGTGTFVFVLIGMGIMSLTVISFAVVSKKARYSK